MITGYPEGANITILNTIYHYPRRMENGKYDNGSIDIIAKDNVTGKKIVECIENPDYPFYVLKDGVPSDHPYFYVSKSQTNEVKVPYKDLLREIARITDNEKFYFDNIKSGNRRANNILHMNNRILFSDMPIENKYRFLFDQKYQNPVIPVTKGYFDIEADIINQRGDFPEPGECPINAVTLINDETREIFTLLLRDKNNPQIEEFEKATHTKELYEELTSFITHTVGGPEKVKKFNLEGFKNNFMFYDEIDEIRMIQDLFILINTLQPDFLMAWNMAFDIPYIIQRIINLGYRPEDIMCHPDFKNPVARYRIDENHLSELAERTDKATISSYTVYLDQMIQFPSIRKGQKKLKHYNLDYIGQVIAGVQKLDYSHITKNIADLPRADYKTFVFYNIVDTIVQKCVEECNKDIEYVIMKALTNNTCYSKIHRQTVYLTNRAAKEFFNLGAIIGNNININNPKPDEKFDGAFVGDPMKVTDYAKRKINGHPVMIFDNLDDYDYARLYPSEQQEYNIAINTQIGKILITRQIDPNEDRYPSLFGFDRSRAFAEDFQSHTWLEFGTRWLNLASFEDLIEDAEEFIREKVIHVPAPYTQNGYKTGGLHRIGSDRMKYNPIKRAFKDPIRRQHFDVREK